MDPDILNVAAIMSLITGLTFAMKLMVFGRGPIRRRVGEGAHEGLEDRVAELEDRYEAMVGDLESRHERRIGELEERLDFAERLLTREQKRAIEPPPAEATPV